MIGTGVLFVRYTSPNVLSYSVRELKNMLGNNNQSPSRYLVAGDAILLLFISYNRPIVIFRICALCFHGKTYPKVWTRIHKLDWSKRVWTIVQRLTPGSYVHPTYPLNSLIRLPPQAKVLVGDDSGHMWTHCNPGSIASEFLPPDRENSWDSDNLIPQYSTSKIDVRPDENTVEWIIAD